MCRCKVSTDFTDLQRQILLIRLKTPHPAQLSVSDFTYVLPPGRIAQHPLLQRDQAKLLIYRNRVITETVFRHLSMQLPEKSVLVFNDTKVIHARIVFRNENKARIEIFLLEPISPHAEMQLAVFAHRESTWRCFIGNAKKWREEKLVKKFRIGDESGTLEATREGMLEGDYLIHLKWAPAQLSFAQVLQAAGYVPLPPYIKRAAEQEDEDQYQTIYAVQDGSVAAPTAGLHFTTSVFDSLKQRSIDSLFTTLHVSAGTFLPVKSQTMEGHRMHHEQIVVTQAAIEKLAAITGGEEKRPVVCVGTTSLRAVESLYWLGRQLARGIEKLEVDQWEPYEPDNDNLAVAESLQMILTFLSRKKMNQLTAETKILLAPGYPFKMADALITNFHLPQSTLLLLIAAFIGEDWRNVYDYALQHGFRFLSYGDGSLLWRRGTRFVSA